MRWVFATKVGYSFSMSFMRLTLPLRSIDFNIKRFLVDITIFCKANAIIDADKMKIFLEQHKHAESWKHISFIMLVVDKEDDHLRVAKIMHGDWYGVDSIVFGEVFASGSGSLDFLKETKENVKIRSQFSPEDISYTLQVNIYY